MNANVEHPPLKSDTKDQHDRQTQDQHAADHQHNAKRTANYSRVLHRVFFGSESV